MFLYSLLSPVAKSPSSRGNVSSHLRPLGPRISVPPHVLLLYCSTHGTQMLLNGVNPHKLSLRTHSYQILPNLILSHRISQNLTESHQMYQISTNFTIAHQISLNLAKFYHISLNHTKSHQLSPYLTKTKC